MAPSEPRSRTDANSSRKLPVAWAAPAQGSPWGAFFAGICRALRAPWREMTAPKLPRDTHEIATRAREAAEAAGEWIPVSSPPTNGNGGTGVAPEATEVESES